MSMIYQTTGLVQTADSQRRNVSVFKNCWNAFQEWRKWERLRRDLCHLSDQELKDIGMARSTTWPRTDILTREAYDRSDDVDLRERWTVRWKLVDASRLAAQIPACA